MLMRWKVLKGPLADVALTKSSRLCSQMTHDTMKLGIVRYVTIMTPNQAMTGISDGDSVYNLDQR